MSQPAKTRFTSAARGLPLLFYRAALPSPRKTPGFAARVIQRHSKPAGSRWRARRAKHYEPVLSSARRSAAGPGARVHLGARGSRGGHHGSRSASSGVREPGAARLTTGPFDPGTG